MLSEKEMQVLELLYRQHLAKDAEIRSRLSSGTDGVSSAIQSLITSEYIKRLEPLMEKSYVITFKGRKALRDAKDSAEKSCPPVTAPASNV